MITLYGVAEEMTYDPWRKCELDPEHMISDIVQYRTYAKGVLEFMIPKNLEDCTSSHRVTRGIIGDKQNLELIC